MEPMIKVSFLIILSLIGLGFFLYGFFLTRRELYNLKALGSLNGGHAPGLVEVARYLSPANYEIDESILTSEIIQGVSALQLSKTEDKLSSSSHAKPENQPQRKKVFLFIVDALRLDFMLGDGTIASSEFPYSCNSSIFGITAAASPSPWASSYHRMCHMQELLNHNASQTMLYGFRADPPTVTSQRLKSLTTGTLPTFVDIGANMNSSAITDDNFLDLLLRRCEHEKAPKVEDPTTPKFETEDEDKRCSHVSSCVVAMGDDTWKALYPFQFQHQTVDMSSTGAGDCGNGSAEGSTSSSCKVWETRSFFYDSFNTRDIDTVDAGIVSHLFEELGAANQRTTPSNDSWELFITHFLGVDHIGHTYHAHHPLMAQRLAWMDALLMQVIQRLPANSVLFLFGDHGMTDAGEHGGASPEETDSGLFVYSTEPMFAVKEKKDDSHSARTTALNEQSKQQDSKDQINTASNTKSRGGGGGEEEEVVVEEEEGECTNNTQYFSRTTSEKLATTTMKYIWNDSNSCFEWVTLQQLLQHPPMIPQTDLTPTLSLLMDLPIPASNLGRVIPELFLKPRTKASHCNNVESEAIINNMNFTRSEKTWHTSTTRKDMCEPVSELVVQALYTNAIQIWTYILHYFDIIDISTRHSSDPIGNAEKTTNFSDELDDTNILENEVAVEWLINALSRTLEDKNDNYSAAQFPYGIDRVYHAHNSSSSGDDHSSNVVNRNKMSQELIGLEKLLSKAFKLHLEWIQMMNTDEFCNQTQTAPQTCSYRSRRQLNETTTGLPELPVVVAAYHNFIREVQAYTREKWTMFKTLPMLVGLFLIALSILGLLLLLLPPLWEQVFHQGAEVAYTATVWHLVCAIVPTIHDSTAVAVLPVSGVASWIRPSTLKWIRLVLLFAASFHVLSPFSNSFVVQEQWTVFHVIQTCSIFAGVLAVLAVHQCISRQTKSNFHQKPSETDASFTKNASSVALLIACILLIMTRTMWSYHYDSDDSNNIDRINSIQHNGEADTLTSHGNLFTIDCDVCSILVSLLQLILLMSTSMCLLWCLQTAIQKQLAPVRTNTESGSHCYRVALRTLLLRGFHTISATIFVATNCAAWVLSVCEPDDSIHSRQTAAATTTSNINNSNDNSDYNYYSAIHIWPWLRLSLPKAILVTSGTSICVCLIMMSINSYLARQSMSTQMQMQMQVDGATQMQHQESPIHSMLKEDDPGETSKPSASVVPAVAHASKLAGIDCAASYTQAMILVHTILHASALLGTVLMKVSHHILLNCILLHACGVVYLLSLTVASNSTPSSAPWTYSRIRAGSMKNRQNTILRSNIDASSAPRVKVSPKSTVPAIVDVTLILAVYFPCLGRFLYFLTDHKMDFGSLQLSVGFLGVEEFDFAYAGSLLAINTFGGFILINIFACALSVHFLRGIQDRERQDVSNISVHDDDGDEEQGDVISAVHSFAELVVQVTTFYQCAILFTSCMAAAILRRHLMVWAIFAPKVAFEACIWGVYSIVSFLIFRLLL